MAEAIAALGTIAAVIDIFSEVFLVAKFMYKTSISAKNHVTERARVQEEFFDQVLLLQSLGVVYFSRRGILLNSKDIHQAWVDYARRTLDRIRRSCLDYVKAAEVDDEDYRLYSPFLNGPKYTPGVIDYPLDEPIPSPKFVRMRGISQSGLRWLGWFAHRSSEKVNEGFVSVKWALYEKERFTQVVQRFRELNGSLKEILPFVCLTGISDLTLLLQRQPDAAVKYPQQAPAHARRLGLQQHSDVQRSLGVVGQKDRILQDYSIQMVNKSPTCSHTVTVASLIPSKQPRKATTVLVEYKPYFPASTQHGTQPAVLDDRIKSLANVLGVAGDEGLSTLPLKGIIDEVSNQRAAFVFDFPKSCDPTKPPKDLYELIRKNDTSLRLNLIQRFQVARKIAESLCSFHHDGWLHKSIRSESICFFRKAKQAGEDSALDVSSPYLVNFEYSRPLHAATRWDSDDDTERNLYRHPKRQGYPTEEFKKIHDVYALGVVLLEIGLWQTAKSIAKIEDGDPINDQTQEHFSKNARSRLDHYMGPLYREAVITCLSGELQAVENVTAAEFAMVFRRKVVDKIAIHVGFAEGDE